MLRNMGKMPMILTGETPVLRFRGRNEMRTMTWLLGLTALTLLAGCQDYYADKLLTQDTATGKLREKFVRTGEELRKAGEIDAYATIPGADKTPIDVWVLHYRQSKVGPHRGTAIILHGMNETKADFPYFHAAKPLTRLGYDVVLIDLRAHGRSGGKYITFGAKEKHDVQAVMDALLQNEQVAQPFYVFGANLGGSVAIQYAAIDNRVKGVVALSPYRDFTSLAAWQMHFLNPVMQPKDVLMKISDAATLGNFELADASTLEAAKKLTCPLLLVHGLLNLSTPLDHAYEIIKAANCPKQLIVLTPGPEEAALALVLEDWIAKRIDEVATGKIPATNPTTQP
jgi:alpha-beta hydrolase superfamily lysophospholipase